MCALKSHLCFFLFVLSFTLPLLLKFCKFLMDVASWSTDLGEVGGHVDCNKQCNGLKLLQHNYHCH
jgi:hypothetical protein